MFMCLSFCSGYWGPVLESVSIRGFKKRLSIIISLRKVIFKIVIERYFLHKRGFNFDVARRRP